MPNGEKYYTKHSSRFFKKNIFPIAKIFSNFTIRHLPFSVSNSRTWPTIRCDQAYKFQPPQALPREKSAYMPRISKKCTTFALLSPPPIRKARQKWAARHIGKLSIRYYFAFSQESLNSEIIRNRD